MNIKPTGIYKHEGQTLSPKLVYAVPDAMGTFLAQNGLAAESAEPVDIDLSHLNWVSTTTLYQPGATIVPGSTSHT
jgi:hypothetical protein